MVVIWYLIYIYITIFSPNRSYQWAEDLKNWSGHLQNIISKLQDTAAPIASIASFIPSKCKSLVSECAVNQVATTKEKNDYITNCMDNVYFCLISSDIYPDIHLTSPGIELSIAMKFLENYSTWSGSDLEFNKETIKYLCYAQLNRGISTMLDSVKPKLTPYKAVEGFCRILKNAKLTAELLNPKSVPKGCHIDQDEKSFSSLNNVIAMKNFSKYMNLVTENIDSTGFKKNEVDMMKAATKILRSYTITTCSQRQRPSLVCITAIIAAGVCETDNQNYEHYKSKLLNEPTCKLKNNLENYLMSRCTKLLNYLDIPYNKVFPVKPTSLKKYPSSTDRKTSSYKHPFNTYTLSYAILILFTLFSL